MAPARSAPPDRLKPSCWLAAGLLAALLVLAHSPAALALDTDEMFADPAREERAREIGRSLRCLVCQNQSIFDSNASLAKDLRVLVRERMDAGDSDDQVIDYVAARYGDYVLLEPPVDTHTYILWLAPIAFVLAGAGAVWVYLAPARRHSPATALNAGEREQAQRILDGDRT